VAVLDRYVRSGFVRKRVIAALTVVAIVAGGTSYVASSWEQQAQQDLVDRTVSNVLSNLPTATQLDEVYQDQNGDLVADSPEREELWARPTELVFSYIASEDSANDAQVWQAAMDAIGQKIGASVRYLRLEDSKNQLEALRNGQLHVTAFGSGTVPVAVNSAGFVPICTTGDAAGGFGYTMNFIVKADSPIKTLDDLRGKQIAFTRPRSNSGCKAALILLMEQHDLQPERDYQWTYSYGHTESIHAVAAGTADAAPVASDILARLIAKGDIEADAFRTIYESERFPPAALGCAYNLAPDLRAAIQTALLELDWTGTRLAEELAAGESRKFVAISYKDDWANIRRVDQAASVARDNLGSR